MEKKDDLESVGSKLIIPHLSSKKHNRGLAPAREAVAKAAVEYVGPAPQFRWSEKNLKFLDDIDDEDFVLIEIGGTGGDYENELFLFAVKGMEREIGEEHFVYVLITYLPIPQHVGEMKTKPTQQAIRLLSQQGIFPDFIVCRAETPLDDVRKKKIMVNANVPMDHIISAPDMATIYDIPVRLEEEGLGEKLLKKMGLEPRRKPDWSRWRQLLERSKNPSRILRVALVGKYVEIGDFQLTDSYISVNQSLLHAGVAADTKVEITWIDGRSFERGDLEVESLADYGGIIVPGAFGEGGAEGVIAALKFARETGMPFLGLCYGMQMAVVEFARHVAGIERATSEEISDDSDYQVVAVQESQKQVLQDNRYGASMRLGAYAAVLKKDSRVLDLYEKAGRINEDAARIRQLLDNPEQSFRVGEIMLDRDKVVLERHRHRYEVNNRYRKKMEAKGLIVSGENMELNLVEMIEVNNHPWFVGVQFHPELKSRIVKAHPLFRGFIAASIEVKDESQLEGRNTEIPVV